MVGLVLFGSLLALARTGKAQGGGEALVDARQALVTLEAELLPQNLVSRLFARDDLEFVLEQNSPSVTATFQNERKRVALLWLERVRGQVRLLRQLHLGSARYYARLDLKTELALTWDFTALLITCRMLQIAFVVGGAYAAPAMVSRVAGTATRICEVSKVSLAFLAGSELDTAGGPPSLTA